MILASILITSLEQEETVLPDKIAENIASFKAAHPNLPHHLFTQSSIRQLIRQNFDAEVLSAYDALKPFSYKADLARYCIMYVHGGVYADLSVHFLRPWAPRFLAALDHRRDNLPGHALRLGLFRDFQSASTWDTAVSLFSSPPGHPSLQLAIRMICENVRRGYYGKNCLCPTGPALFGKAIAMSCHAEDLIVGDSRWIAPRPPLAGLITESSHGFVFRSKLIAVSRKKGGGSLAELGIQGGNQYARMWAARDVYEIPREDPVTREEVTAGALPQV